MAESNVLDNTDPTSSRLRDANDQKIEGNEFFRAKQWNQALVAYQAGIGRLPKRPGKVSIPNNPDHSPEPDDKEAVSGNQISPRSSEPEPLSESDLEFAKIRAVLNANIGACHVKLGEHKQAVEACSQALLDDPQYVKALQRRAASHEAINSWSSLTAAQQDYNDLLKLALSPSEIRECETKIRLIKPKVEAAQKKETAEMLDKLKGLGNSILGNFGLSTDNFKFEPNGQGGYSMNFAQ